MFSREKIINVMKNIKKESEVIKPYIIICQPRRDLKEVPAQNLDGYEGVHIDLLGYSHAFCSIGGEVVDVARNYLFDRALESGAKYMLFVGEDTVLPYDGFRNLHKTAEENPGCAVVGVYYIKFSAAMIMVKDGDYIRTANVDRGQVFEVWQAGMDAMLIPISIIKAIQDNDPEIPFTCIGNKINTGEEIIHFVGEDNFFYHRLRQCGFKVLCNTDVQCLHVDLASGKYTAHPSIKKEDYFTNIPITEPFSMVDKREVDKRWSSRLPKQGEITSNLMAYLSIVSELLGKDKTYVELGAGKCRFYFSLCENIKKYNLNTECYGIDTWLGDNETGPYDKEVEEECYKANKEYKFSTLIKGKFKDVVHGFQDESISVLLIDGLHGYYNVKEDFEIYLPKMKKDGIVLFHDINVKKTSFGVNIFWDEIKKKYKYKELTNTSEGLGILYLGEPIEEVE